VGPTAGVSIAVAKRNVSIISIHCSAETSRGLWHYHSPSFAPGTDGVAGDMRRLITCSIELVSLFHDLWD